LADSAAHAASSSLPVPRFVAPAGSATAGRILSGCSLIFNTQPGLPQATLWKSYTEPLSVFGGAAPYSFELTGGALPPGIALSPEGVLSGKPAGAFGSFNFSVKVKDAAGAETVQSFFLYVEFGPPPFQITKTHTGALASGTETTYSIVVTNPWTGVGAISSNGLVSVTDTLPSGLTRVSIEGDGWTCGWLDCWRFDPLAPGSNYPPILVRVLVGVQSGNAAVNKASVQGGGLNGDATQDSAIVGAPATISLTSTPGASTLGQAVTLVAVTGAGTTGKVTFYDGTTILGIAAVSGGQATITTTQLPVGSRKLRALYPGDGTHGVGISPIVTQVVSGLPSAPPRTTALPFFGSPAQQVLVLDFNGDGKSDIAARWSTGFGIARGYGDGTFERWLTAQSPSEMRGMAQGDFNGDGKVDLAFATESAGSGSVRTYLSNGDGSLIGSVATPMVALPSALVVADFDGDGKADVAVLRTDSSVGSVLLGNGDGSFRLPAIDFSCGPSACDSIVVNDFNGDGIPDLATGNFVNSQLSILLGNGDGSFQAPRRVSVGSFSNFLATEDFNGDGKADLAVVPGVGSVVILLGNGDGSFQTAVPYAVAAAPVNGITLGDFDGDGRLDLALANPGKPGITIMAGNGDGTFRAPVTYSLPGLTYSMAVGDFNGDGRADLVGTLSTSSDLAILFGNAAALGMTISHQGNFGPGQSGTYSIIVSNSAGAGATLGAVTVSEIGATELGAPLTITSMSGGGWTCGPTSCTRSDQLAAGASYPPITVSATVTSKPPSFLTNVATVTGGNSPDASASDVTLTATDLALGKTSTQSSTFGAAAASRAIDGVTDGDYFHNSVSVTAGDPASWWEVDLGGPMAITSIAIWGRTDGSPERLSDYWVFVSDTPFGPADTVTALQQRAATFSNHQTVRPSPVATIPVSAAGRYVRVQLNQPNYLQLAEVMVFGAPGPVSVSVSPGSSTLLPNQSQQFTATVNNTANHAVTWSLSPNVGTISAGGVYVAPATVGAPQTVTVTATSMADGSKSGSATVSLVNIAVSNLALGRNASQSSTFASAGAGLAVDGNTDGDYFHNSVSVTAGDAASWWQIDLGVSATITSVGVWNRTDGSVERLSNYWVFVSDTPFGPADTPAILQGRAGTWSINQTTRPNPSQFINVIAVGQLNAPRARYVRIQLNAPGFLQLAEVQVFGILPVSVSSAPVAATLSASGTQQFTATVSNAVDTSVSWSVSPNVGSVSSAGLYTAPASVSTPQTVTVRATSLADGTAFAESTVTLLPSVSVAVAPGSATLVAQQSQQFIATVANASNTGVTWSLIPNVGSISGAGLYTAPPSVSIAQPVTVKATSMADPSKSAIATVMLLNTSVSNMALGKTATQSSTFDVASAARAVDGNTDGNYAHGSLAVTAADPGSWWQVDLGASQAVSGITLWNRTDGSMDRLGNYWLFVSDTPFGANDSVALLQVRAGTWSSHQTTYPNPVTSIPVNAQGRYVRIQLNAPNFLQLAEVQVFGASVSVGVAPGAATLIANQTQQLTATVANAVNTAVTWSLSPNVGTITGAGLYTAPALVTMPQTVTVTATSVADGSKSASATISLATLINLAAGRSAGQSSTFGSAAASRAVDGNTDGDYFHNSVSVTNGDPLAWWEVDLGVSAAITNIVIWNRTDGSSDRLGNFWVFVSDTPFGDGDTAASLSSRPGTWSSHQTTYPSPSVSIPAGVQGRYVRIQLNSPNYLQLAEVQILGPPVNLAAARAASQSSTYSSAAAARAVDGNTDGNYSHNSVSVTAGDAASWWEVDLGSSAVVSSIAIWNRTDGSVDRLRDYWVFVSDTPFGAADSVNALAGRAGTWSIHQTSTPAPSSAIAVNARGRYVRVQLSSPNYLQLAEVQVFGF
jgi:hypothetical protein